MELSMTGLVPLRSLSAGKMVLAALTLLFVLAMPHRAKAAGLGSRHVDPAKILPLDQFAPQYRDVVAEVIRDHTFHRQGEPEAFQCQGNLYLSLVNEPLLPLTLWKDLSDSSVQLHKVGPNRYEGTDGAGSSAVWEFAFRSPRLHVLLSYLNYVSPRGNARIDARIVLIVHSAYSSDSRNEPLVTHDVEAYVKVDSKGWKTLARTVRPIVERVLEDQVREAGYFISLMSRLVVTYPNWACQLIGSQSAIDLATRQRFRELVLAARRPEASSGRPVVVQNSTATADARRR
jgi:hypothetical protein